jgi:hypothetical protein
MGSWLVGCEQFAIVEILDSDVEIVGFLVDSRGSMASDVKILDCEEVDRLRDRVSCRIPD